MRPRFDSHDRQKEREQITKRGQITTDDRASGDVRRSGFSERDPLPVRYDIATRVGYSVGN